MLNRPRVETASTPHRPDLSGLGLRPWAPLASCAKMKIDAVQLRSTCCGARHSAPHHEALRCLIQPNLRAPHEPSTAVALRASWGVAYVHHLASSPQEQELRNLPQSTRRPPSTILCARLDASWSLRRERGRRNRATLARPIDNMPERHSIAPSATQNHGCKSATTPPPELNRSCRRVSPPVLSPRFVGNAVILVIVCRPCCCMWRQVLPTLRNIVHRVSSVREVRTRRREFTLVFQPAWQLDLW